MRHGLRRVATDPDLRVAALSLLLFGALTASVGVHQSLVAVEVMGLSDGAYALLLFGASLVGVAASVAIGILGDRRPLRRALAMLTVGASLLGALVVWAWPAPAPFALASLLLLPVGATVFGQVFALGRLVASDLPPGARDAVMGTLRAVFALPWLVVPPLWSLVLERGASILAVYPVAAALALLHLLLVARAWPRDARLPATRSPEGRWTRALGEVAALPVMARVALVGALHVAPALTGIVLGLVFAQAGRPASQVGLFFGAFVLVEIVVSLLLGRIARGRDRLAVIGAGAALYAAFHVLLPLLAPTPWVWALTLLAGAGGGLIFTLAIAYLQDLLAHRPGAGASLLAVQGLASNGLTTLAYGAGTWAGGYAAAGALAALVMLLALLTLLRLDRA